MTIEHLRLTRSNIVCTPLEQFPNGSLDYLDLDESETFNYRTSTPKAEEALKRIIEEKWLDKVSIIDDPIPTKKEKVIKEVKVVKTTKKSIENKLAMVDSSEFGF